MMPDTGADLDKQRGAIGGTARPFSSSSSLTSGPSLRGAHTQGHQYGERGRVETPELTYLRCISLYKNQFTLLAQSRSELVHLPSEVVYKVYSAVHTPVYSQNRI